MSDALLLSLLWSVPLVGALVVLLIPRRAELAIKVTALGITLLTFGLTIYALAVYLTPNASGRAPVAVPLAERAAQNIVQADAGSFGGPASRIDVPNDLVVRTAWVPYFRIEYFLGADGISLALLVLTALVSVLACLASWSIATKVQGYFSLFLVLLASMMGVFLALDIFLFYVFFEVMLLPMYFLIGIWGGEEREYAAIKFLLYTLLGSVFILVAILILYFWTGPAVAVGGEPFTAHSFDMVRVAQVAASTGYYPAWIQRVIFVLFFIGFAVKLPSFPFHTWLPDAHVQAPTPISMILAGVLLKVGGYGLVRLAWPLAPLGAAELSWYVAALGVFSILYGALAAMAQTDFKRLVAYSSISHMGYVTLGLAAMSMLPQYGLTLDPRYWAYGVNGAMYMMLAHGITSAGMFFLVGVIYDRAHTRDLRQLGGLFHPMPGYGAVSFLIFFGAMGLPGLCGFIGEVFVVLSAFNYHRPMAVLAAAAVVLTAGYILWTLQRVFLGRNERYRGMPDLTAREWAVSLPLVVLTIALGIFPQAVLSWMGPSVDAVVRDASRATAQMAPATAVAQAQPPAAPAGLPR